MRRLNYVVLLALSFGVLACSQWRPIPIDDSWTVFLHRIGKLGRIHATDVAGPEVRVKLRAIVRRSGEVEYAHAIEGPARFFREAEEVELSRRFKPFERDGKRVRAEITDYVEVVPLERWGQKERFPEVKDWDSLRFTIERPQSCATCLAYRVEVRGDGVVIFHSLNAFEEFPPEVREKISPERLILGTYRGTISRQEVAGLLEAFQRADYFSLKDGYERPAQDVDAVATSITIDGRTKSVVDQEGSKVGMPEAVGDVEMAMDKAAVASFRAQGLTEQADKLQAAVDRRH
jgi:hypothetical protein